MPFRMDLAARLDGRQAELEREALTRVCAVADPAEVEDPDYAAGLPAAVTSGIAYGIAAIETGKAASMRVPIPLISQARVAARNGVALDTVLRRYLAGYTLLVDRILEEAHGAEALSVPELRRVLRDEAVLLERVVSSVSEEFAREGGSRPKGLEQHRTEQVRALLAGELLDAAALAYELDAWHLGAIASGPGARAALRALARALDLRLLMVCGDAGKVWAWFGAHRRVSSHEAMRVAESRWPAEAQLALGEVGRGVEGWRLTHRQAKAAIAVALRTEASLIRYADVALLAAAIHDDVLATSLRDAYLAPLEQERDGGATLRETLSAYFRAERNVSSAAAVLGMSRNTVRIRLRSIEERIGRPVDGCAGELETALRLKELT